MCLILANYLHKLQFNGKHENSNTILAKKTENAKKNSNHTRSGRAREDREIASKVSPVESGPEERPDEAEAASQEAAERAPPAPAAAAGIPPRGRRHLQVRVRRVLHQRVPDHVYVPATAAAAADDAAGRGRASRGRGVLRRRQDVPEAGVPVPAAASAVAVVVAPGAVGDIDHRRRPRRRRALLGRAPVPQLEVAGGRAVGER